MTNGWLLLENSGPWDYYIPSGTVLVPETVAEAARLRRIRINLVRRRRQLFSRDSQQCFLAGNGTIRQWRRNELYRRLPDELDAVIDGTPAGGGTPVPNPMYLVCTNESRSPSCGRQGQRVREALQAAAGDRVWETTHVGGCRLAVNLVCLPTGIYYSGVTPDHVPAIVAATERGRIVLNGYRGRGGLPMNVQAAELAVRRKTGIDTLNGVRPVAAEKSAGDVALVRVDTEGGAYEVFMRRNDVIAMNAI
jgi:(2Fe-2S) ferredoxin